MMKDGLKRLASVAFFFALFAVSAAENQFNDNIDRTDPNFVKASLLITGPGEELYSSVGHSCIRLECEKFNLDYCYTYESENVPEKILTFFSGNLKMGMFAVPTKLYLAQREQVDRGVIGYQMNLPPDVKQRLWKVLDEKASIGFGLPYDYIRRGCAQALFNILLEAIGNDRIHFAPWPEYFNLTRREIVSSAIAQSHPWNVFFLHAIWGSEADWKVSRFQKVVLPSDLVKILQAARVDGQQVVQNDSIRIQDAKVSVQSPSVFSPKCVSWFVFIIAVMNVFMRLSFVDGILLAVQSGIGLFVSYLVFFSTLPASSWNWLIIPFNLLPLVFWRYRRKWAGVAAGSMVVWLLALVLSPHKMTDSTYLILVMALTVMYSKELFGSFCKKEFK